MSELTLAQVVTQLETLYPLRYAESWDYPGLIIGEPSASVKKIYCAVDPSIDIAREAVAWGADLLITHHPLWFRSVHTISGAGHRGYVAQMLIQNHCALWVGHTNADAAHRGVSHVLADELGLTHQVPLVPLSDPTSPYPVGEGRVGELKSAISLYDLAQRVNALIPPTKRGIDVAGDLDMLVRHIAIVGGSGDSLLNEVRQAHVDVYITSDLRHHPTLDAMQQAQREADLRAQGITVKNEIIHGIAADYDVDIKPALINIPHYAAEKKWFDYAIPDLLQALKEQYDIVPEISLSETDTDPWTLHLDSPQEPHLPR